MNIKLKLDRSKSTENVDFSKYQSINVNDVLVKVTNTRKIVVKPNWTIPGDFEGGMYADYINSHPEYDGIYVRTEVLKRLNIAANLLKSPYKLVIRAGHRPIDVQKRLLKECANDYLKEHPNVSSQEALEHARDFVSDPETTLPPHVCGAAVDVEIIDSSKNENVDFGSTMNDDNDMSYLYYPNLTDTQKSNRLMLMTVMLEAGFASCMTEWWHYSYGDQLWAWFYGKDESLYSPIDLKR